MNRTQRQKTNPTGTTQSDYGRTAGHVALTAFVLWVLKTKSF